MKYSSESRMGAACAIVGSVVLVVGTYLHPMHADPHDVAAAFTAYAADRLWVASHLTQLAGVVLIVAALLSLAHQLEVTSHTGWSRLAGGGAIASLAVATALQAVDGVALKVMVDTWAAAPVAHKEVTFYAAFIVRQVEVGFASTASLLFGLTATVYGVALLRVPMYPKWVAGLALVGGVPATIAGVMMAYPGFSGIAMAIHMPAYSLLVVWMLTLGVCMWRRGGILPEERTVSYETEVEGASGSSCQRYSDAFGGVRAMLSLSCDRQSPGPRAATEDNLLYGIAAQQTLGASPVTQP